MSLTYGMLDGSYSAAQFAEIGLNAFGDGVCAFGGRFEVTARGSNGVAVNTGFALAGGYWVKNTASLSIYIPYGESAGGRYDAIVLRVDKETRASGIVLEQGEAAAEPVKYEPVRNGERHELVLAYIYVAPATTMIADSNITDTRADADLCGMIPPSAELAKSVLPVYAYILSGFSEDMAALTADARTAHNTILANIQALADTYDEAAFAVLLEDLKAILDGVASLQPAWEKIDQLETAISRIDAVQPSIGDLRQATAQPTPARRWLPCDGSGVPAEYPDLIELIGDTLPSVTPADARLRAWIYGGEPTAQGGE